MAHHCSNKALGLLIFLSLLSTICSAQLVPEFTHSEPVDPADAVAPAPEVDEDGAELAPAPSIEFENDEPLTPPPLEIGLVKMFAPTMVCIVLLHFMIPPSMWLLALILTMQTLLGTSLKSYCTWKILHFSTSTPIDSVV